MNTYQDDPFAAFAYDPTFDGPRPGAAQPAAGFTCDNGSDDKRGMFTDADAAARFMRAGKATLTLVSRKTGARFTYRVSTPTDRATGKPVTDGTLMVSVLNGPDNGTNYKWLGRVARDIFWIGRKNPQPGEIARDAPCAVAFDWAWRQLIQGNLPAQLEVWHEDRCGRCGRKLTVPSSISQGFGPECVTKIGL